VQARWIGGNRCLSLQYGGCADMFCTPCRTVHSTIKAPSTGGTARQAVISTRRALALADSGRLRPGPARCMSQELTVAPCMLLAAGAHDRPTTDVVAVVVTAACRRPVAAPLLAARCLHAARCQGTERPLPQAYRSCRGSAASADGLTQRAVHSVWCDSGRRSRDLYICW
jgi:hypothetical protein